VLDNNNLDNNKVILKTEKNQKTQSNEDCKAGFGLNEHKKKTRTTNKSNLT